MLSNRSNHEHAHVDPTHNITSTEHEEQKTQQEEMSDAMDWEAEAEEWHDVREPDQSVKATSEQSKHHTLTSRQELFSQATLINSLDAAREFIETYPDITHDELVSIAAQHEEIAHDVIRLPQLSKDDKIHLAKASVSICIKLMMEDQFTETLSGKECYELKRHYKDHSDFNKKLDIFILFTNKVREYEREMNDFILTINEDTPQIRQQIATWFIENNFSADRLVKIGNKNVIVAHVILDHQRLWEQLISKLRTYTPMLIDMACHHSAIALRLIHDQQFVTHLTKVYNDYSNFENQKTGFYYLCKAHPTLLEDVDDISDILNQLPTSELAWLGENDERIKRNPLFSERINTYNRLKGSLIGLTDAEVGDLILLAKLNWQELVHLAGNIMIAKVLIEDERFSDFLKNYIHKILPLHSEITESVLQNEKLKNLLIDKRYYLYSRTIGIIKWKSVCYTVLQDPMLNAGLTGEMLLEMENLHGFEIARLILLNPALQKRLLSHKNTPEYNVSTALYNHGLKVLEKPLRREQDNFDKIGLASAYFRSAALLGHQAAYDELIKLAQTYENTIITSFLAIEMALIKNDVAIAQQLAENKIIRIINDGNLQNILDIIIWRLMVPENSLHLDVIGNFYFEAVSSLEASNLTNLIPVYRCLADMLEEFYSDLALDYMCKIPQNQLDANNFIFMGNCALSKTYQEQRKLLLDQDIENIDLALKHPELIIQRYVAALPYYIKATLNDESAKSVSDRMIEELLNLPLSDNEKISALMNIAWQVVGTSSKAITLPIAIWVAAEKLGSEQAKFVINNLFDISRNYKLLGHIKSINDNNIVDGFSLLSDMLDLPKYYHAIRKSFVELINDKFSSVEKSSNFKKRLAELAELDKNNRLEKQKHIRDCDNIRIRSIKKSALEDIDAYYAQDFSAPIVVDKESLNSNLKAKKKLIEERQAFVDKFKLKVDEVIDPLIEKLNQDAQYYRADDCDDDAECCGMRADFLTTLKAELFSHANDYSKLEDDLFDYEKFRAGVRQIVAIEQGEADEVMRNHAAWYAPIAAMLLRALHTIFPCSSSVTNWMRMFDGRMKVLPDHQERDDMVSEILRP